MLDGGGWDFFFLVFLENVSYGIVSFVSVSSNDPKLSFLLVKQRYIILASSIISLEKINLMCFEFVETFLCLSDRSFPKDK